MEAICSSENPLLSYRMSEMRNLPPRIPLRSRGRRALFKLLFAAVVLVAVLSGSIGLYIDSLWFESLGFLPVYWYGIQTRATTFVVFLIVTTLFVYGAFRILLGDAGPSRRPFLEVQGRYVDMP